MLVDLEKFTDYLRKNVRRDGKHGECALYVRKALEVGAGAKITGGHPSKAKMYGPTLESLGFHKITVDDPDQFNFIKGDVMVMEPWPGSASDAGHIAGYDGQTWFSDFRQLDFWAGPDYRRTRPSYAVYRQ
jgi:hypothetical protein